MATLEAQVSTYPKKEKREGFLTKITPKWGRAAGDWIRDQNDPGWYAVGVFLALVLFIVGGGMLFGGGYASIQGVRLPLAFFRLIEVNKDWPALIWWIIPAICTLVQVFAKHLPPAVRNVWRGSMVYDGATTGIFAALALIAVLTAYGHAFNMYAIAGVAAVVGLLNGVGAESVFLSGLYMLASALRRKSR